MNREAQIETLVTAIRSLDLDAAVGVCSAAARLYFCGQLVASGRPAIRRVLLPFFTILDAFEHRTIASWSGGGVSVVEADVQYSSVDGERAAIPVTSVVRWNQSQIEECRISTVRENTWRAA